MSRTSETISSCPLVLHASMIKTPIGEMIALADKQRIYMLEFVEWPRLEKALTRMSTQLNSIIEAGDTAASEILKQELNQYFSGSLQSFQTSIALMGSEFQKLAWQALLSVPYGQTRSYSEQAFAIGKASACRAVANANGTNLLSIILPCHRIINSDGKLGGYGGGLYRKQWLLAHEAKHSSQNIK